VGAFFKTKESNNYLSPGGCEKKREQYKEQKMQTIKEILEMLEDDSTAWLLRPATQKDITECQKNLKELELEPLPKGYIDFLKMHNGFAWNGIEYYGTYQVSEVDNPNSFKLIDIVTMNDEFNDWYELDDKVLLGRADEDYYTYDIKTQKYEVLERESREAWEQFDTFGELFSSSVGGRLGLEELGMGNEKIIQKGEKDAKH